MSEFAFSLTAEEAVLLAPIQRPEVAAMVARASTALSLASSGLSESEAAMVAQIVATATAKGRLTYSPTMISSCPCCKRRDGYHPYARAGRYHRKGQPDFSKPKTFRAVDLDRGFVTVQNHISVGFCDTCLPRVQPVLLPLLENVRAEFPTHWAGTPQRFRRYDNRECTACGWAGHEGQMRPMRTLMGNGSYAGGCPDCPAENLPLGRTIIKTVPGFTLVERPAPSPSKDQHP